MKYQNFAVIFVIILLPLSMVLSYYIQMQTETLTLQTNYLNKLNDSTYDAVAAYQMNSLNTQRVTGESVKSYVLASVNTFFTTLATNLGMSSASKQYLLPYVPAILFTTYDGYYIYSPLKMEKVAEHPDTGIGLKTKDGDIIYVSNTADINFKVTEADCTEIEEMEKGSDVNARYSNYTNDKTQARIEYKYMLKPFIYYSTQYKETTGDKYDFVASYTLDNYVTLYGKRKISNTADSGITASLSGDSSIHDTFSKSGYLIDPTKIGLSGDILIKGVTRNGEISTSEPSESGKVTYTSIIKANSTPSEITHNHVRYRSVDITSSEAYNFINYYYYGENSNENGYYPGRVTRTTVGLGANRAVRYQTGDDIIEQTLDIEDQKNDNINYPEVTEGTINSGLLINSRYRPIEVTYNGIPITDRDAKEYYIKAYFFSKWVLNNLGENGVKVKAENVVQNETTKIIDGAGNNETRYEFTDFRGDNTLIFEINGTDNNPEEKDSYMSEHRRSVIKNSIQFNLNTAISTYDTTYFGTATNEPFKLPVLTTNDWESILNNVSMTAFMQGMPCGLSTFNNYSVVKSNNNNTCANLENIYFTKEIYNSDEQVSKSDYHKYDCLKLQTDNNSSLPPSGYYVSDLSSEFKYDAKKINMRVKSPQEDGSVICLFDDSTNTYYEIDSVKSNENGILSIGKPIDNDRIKNYTGPIYTNVGGEWKANGTITTDLTALPNGSDILYLYDHQNLGCYDCITSGNYIPVVKYFMGDLRRIFLTNNKETLVAIEESGMTTFYYEDGREYTGSAPTPDLNTIDNGYNITKPELNVRKQSIYTAIAKHRNSLYKTNDYVNR